MTRQKIRAVVFDMDGLMFNTEELYAAVGQEVLRRRKKQLDDELLHAMMGRPTRVALKMMIDRYGLDATVEQISQESAEIFRTLLDEKLETMPGLWELLDALEKANIPKGIATSSRRLFVTDVLSRFQLEDRFRFVLTSDDIVHGKPHAEVYLKTAQQFGVHPREILVLEDSAIGCQAALAAGVFTVAVPSGRSRQHDFGEVQVVAHSLADLQIYRILGIDHDPV